MAPRKPLRTILLFCGTLLLSLARGGQAADLAAAWQAEAMVGDEVWSQVVRIENRRPGGSYGREVIATVFEFNDRLWFYTASEGTQSLSVYANRLERDKADLHEVLAHLHEGFVDYAPVVAPKADAEHSPQKFPKLANGCFIESLHALRNFVNQGTLITEARLLLYYAEAHGRIIGHTGLYFATPVARFFWDPEQPEDRRRITASEDAAAIDIARRVARGPARGRLTAARFVGVEELPEGRPVYARAGGARSG